MLLDLLDTALFALDLLDNIGKTSNTETEADRAMREKIERDTHIIQGCTDDPIQAIRLVREHIFKFYDHAPHMAAWKGNADGVMYDWLMCDEAKQLGISHVQYRNGIRKPKGKLLGVPIEWIICKIKNGKKYYKVIIDLSINVTMTKLEDGSVCVSDCSDEVTSTPYIITKNGQNGEVYKGDTSSKCIYSNRRL